MKLGFKPKEGNLDKVAPGKMITRGQYFNRNEHLPEKPGRIWYEADINYSGATETVKEYYTPMTD